MNEQTTVTNLENLSFEDAMIELESIVRRLEEGKANLEDAMMAYERGAALKAHCEKKLQLAQTRIEKITLNKAGNITSETVNSLNLA